MSLIERSADREIVVSTTAMATDVVVRVASNWPNTSAECCTNALHAARDALGVFTEVDLACTRFDPASPLMRANERPWDWHRVPEACFDAIHEAWWAYRKTKGRFDPRVFSDLVALGYDRSFGSLERTGAKAVGDAPERRLAPQAWEPRFRRSRRAVCLGGSPVDLGGIGKGLALRWASASLSRESRDFIVNAGGDCYCAGYSPDGGAWSVGIEDPLGGDQPVAVVALSGLAAATSSTRVRRWRRGGTQMHHLIDPRTGLPGGFGLVAVTVVAPDPAAAEVSSKVLFLAGRGRVGGEAERQGVAACWITAEGRLEMNAAFEEVTRWRRP